MLQPEREVFQLLPSRQDHPANCSPRSKELRCPSEAQGPIATLASTASLEAMITSTTRTTRTRFPSPAQPKIGTWNGDLDMAKGSASQGSRAFMQRWLEPTVQSKASFEDDGLMRYGVVENMVPLGTLPKPKKGNETTSNVRKIILKTSGSKDANSAVDVTPRSPVAVSPPPPEAPPTPPRRKSLALKHSDDEDYDPKEGSRRRQSGRASLSRKPRRTSGARRSSIIVSKAVTPKEMPYEAPEEAPKEVVEVVEVGEVVEVEPEDKEFTDRVIESAVDEALKHYRYPTAWALRILYDEKSGDPKFVSMIEQVFNQTADAATMRKFSDMIEEKKREGKKDNQGCYYFVPPSTNNRFTPHKPKAAPYANLLHTAEILEDFEARPAKKIKSSHTRETPGKMASAGGINGEMRTPSRRRARRDSASSDSSLSSAMSLSSPEASVSVGIGVGVGVGVDVESLNPTFRGGTTGHGSESKDAPKSRPIKTRGKSLASKQGKSSPSRSISPTLPIPSHSPSIHVDAGMPGKISNAPLFPNLSSKGSKATKTAGKAHLLDEDDDDSLWDRRREAQKVTNSINLLESSVRGGDEDEDATPTRKARRTRYSHVSALSTRATRSASKRPHDDSESVVSPIPWSQQGDGSSTVGSRAVTPTTLRQPKKQRTGLRIKSSPVKKRGGTAAGVPRSMGEAHSSATNGISRDQVSENNVNDEYCSACGNAGDVVCCDGCPRSFHFECVGMVQTETLPDEWFCNECLHRRYPSRMAVYKGAFASALTQLDRTIPRAFSLPKSLQTMFEGVKAGNDGDYEEVTTNKTTKKKNGYEEIPDFFRQREDGKAVLCHDCQKPATDVRSIIPCSICALYWHIDCLDPPLTVPPVLKTWRCPAHVDEVLTESHSLTPAHRFRKLKGAQSITPLIPRGAKNNGYIEVDWSDEPELPNNSGWHDPESFGHSYKLPAQGIVLDFVEQLRREGAGYGPRRNESRWMMLSNLAGTHSSSAIRGSSLTRTVEEMQVSLNLTSLKERKSDDVDQLTSALLSAADQNVLTLMAKANADNIAAGRLTDEDRLGLRALLTQMNAMSTRVRQLLGEDAPCPGVAAAPLGQGSALDILSPENSAIADQDDKVVTAPPPVTEPTPPSTIDHAEGAMELD